jgi:citrate synthase
MWRFSAVLYERRRTALRTALAETGFRIDHSEAGLYLWATRDDDAWETTRWFADRGIVVAPGTFYGDATHVRVALTATDERVAAAVARLDGELVVSRPSVREPSHSSDFSTPVIAKLLMGSLRLEVRVTDYSLQHPGGDMPLPVVPATEGESGLSISTLLKDTGHVTLDHGFVNTASCSSAITFIDGEAGILRYRGYPIEQLAEQSTFLETSYLLIYGSLPTEAQLEEFTASITKHTMLHEDLRRFFDGFPRDAHPMAVLSSAVSALSTFYQDSLDPFDAEQVHISTIRLMAKLPTIAAYAYKKSVGQPFLYPDNAYTFEDNFLRMTFGVPAEAYEVNPVVSRALDQLLILHADHEQNCSTSTVRLVGSSHANLFASVSAGVNALFGPLHGGANQAVLEMLENIHASGGGVNRFIRSVKEREAGVKLMGFGHRVYKNYDPRAAVVKKTAYEVFEQMNVDDPLLDIALRLEEVALADEFFIERKLYPNVDFYTGLIYKAMGFPTRMFTVLFALGRLPGWIAQWREMIEDPTTKIGRPRQVYVGETLRDYTPMPNR